MRRFAIVTLLASSAVLLFACAPNDVVVADIPQEDGGKPSQQAPCVSDKDCAANQFCDRDTCGAETGHCRNEPPYCDGRTDNECGCDGITYWNDCLRAQAGVSKSAEGPCAGGAMCGAGSGGCNGSAKCGRLVFHDGDCSADPPGQCWVLPDTCPPDDSHWLSCTPASPCTSVCDAIKSEQPYFHAEGQSCP